MLVVMLRKVLAKKWMTLCVLLGSILLIASLISLPLYQNAAFDRMLRDEFDTSYGQTGIWPGQILVEKDSRQRTGAAYLHQMEAFFEEVDERLGVTPKEYGRYYQTVERQVNSLHGRETHVAHYKIRLNMYSDTEEHFNVLNGEMFSEDGLTEEGYTEVLITEECMLENGFVVGEVLGFSSMKDRDTGERYMVKIIGIVEPKEDDIYWQIGCTQMQNVLLIKENIFRDLFLTDWVNEYLITCRYCYLFEYDNLTAGQVERMLAETQSELYDGNIFGEILENYQAKLLRIKATLAILQVPLVILLVSFLYMITKQMYEVERNEIAVIKSRGSSRFQIFRLYFYQIVLVAGLASVAGIPLGVLFSQLLGSASGFLEFKVRRSMEVVMGDNVIYYFLAAVIAIIGVMTLPAIKHSKVSIVHLKQSKAAGKRAFWEVCFLDVICLGVALYGYYSYQRSAEHILEDVLNQKSLDPLMYMSSSLFVIGAGLLFLRLQPLLAKLLYFMGQKFWKPATYASLLEMVRSSKKQQFVMLFLILTISLGTFHATVAQTIMSNAEDNTEYLSAVDVIMREQWKNNAGTIASGDEDGEFYMRFYAADEAKYKTIPGLKAYTKVYYDDDSQATRNLKMGPVVNSDGFYGQKATYQTMLIHPKEFGEMTWLDRDFTEEHYYEYLNRLTDNPNGFLISRSLAESRGLREGSSIKMSYNILMARVGQNSYYQDFDWSGTVVGIVDYWPSYDPSNVYLDEYGELIEAKNHLVVGNYRAFEKVIGILPQPYEIWVDLEEGEDSAQITRWIQENDVPLERYVNGQAEFEATMTDPLLQGTNGILTLEFVVMILLCAVGYLVYWVMSIRDREMMFGVLRAFGMHKGELFRMLLLEQLLSGGLAVAVAVLIGNVVSEMFTPMMQAAYMAAEQVLPLRLSVDSMDIMRLYVSVAIVLIICLGVLTGYVLRLNMTKALKLGED